MSNPLDSLRKAIEQSPENVPLRQHLAETLLAHGFTEEAEKEFRGAIQLSPHDPVLKLGLAQTFYQNGNYQSGLVLLEELMKASALGPQDGEIFLLYARFLQKNQEIESAKKAYQQAVQLNQGLADPLFAHELGIAQTISKEPVRLYANEMEERSTSFGELEKPTLAFHDVGGMEEVKEEVRLKIIHPLHHPEMYKAYGKTIGGGILLYGPPGCGKTYLARATAGEVKAAFLSVGIHEVLDMYLGNSEQNLHKLFPILKLLLCFLVKLRRH